MNTVSGFSKMSKEQKIKWLADQVSVQDSDLISKMDSFWLVDPEEQKKFDEFSENTLTNFDLPFGIAPNFLINGKIYSVPMVIEESSVVAAASLAAKFWLQRGGFHTRIISTLKVGQVHFLWSGKASEMNHYFQSIKQELIDSVSFITENMSKRGGGIVDIELIDLTHELENYYQLKVTCETKDAMGANFINSILEEMAQVFKRKFYLHDLFETQDKELEVVMCILSNYTPDCLVECFVECDIQDLGSFPNEMSPDEFARKFATAVKIAQIDKNRAVTHNKGIMNGVDSVVLATGNDFRAVEACAHAWASRDGRYRSLSSVSLDENKFRFSILIPLAVGTVGGLTSLHPLAKTSLAILGHPSAQELMQIIASVGLAQNFGAVKSLVTTGIQKGHMKLHLLNILNQLDATEIQIEAAKDYFADKIVSFTAVRNFINIH